jgi:hypothetical protein
MDLLEQQNVDRSSSEEDATTQRLYDEMMLLNANRRRQKASRGDVRFRPIPLLVPPADETE